jgi:hypothetical protein
MSGTACFKVNSFGFLQYRATYCVIIHINIQWLWKLFESISQVILQMTLSLLYSPFLIIVFLDGLVTLLK